MTNYKNKLPAPKIKRIIYIGCGACEHSCPTIPVKAITVSPFAVIAIKLRHYSGYRIDFGGQTSKSAKVVAVKRHPPLSGNNPELSSKSLSFIAMPFAVHRQINDLPKNRQSYNDKKRY